MGKKSERFGRGLRVDEGFEFDQERGGIMEEQYWHLVVILVDY